MKIMGRIPTMKRPLLILAVLLAVTMDFGTCSPIPAPPSASNAAGRSSLLSTDILSALLGGRSSSARSLIPTSVIEHIRRETLDGHSASQAVRSSRASSPQAITSRGRKVPSIQSAKLLSHVISEGSSPFLTVNNNQASAKQVSVQAPQPFTLPAQAPQPFTLPAQAPQPFTLPAQAHQPFTLPAQAPQPFTLPNVANSKNIQGSSVNGNNFQDDEIMLLRLLEQQLMTGRIQGNPSSKSSSNGYLKPTSHSAVYEDNNRIIIDLASLGGRHLPINNNNQAANNALKSINANGAFLSGSGNAISNTGNVGVPIPVNSVSGNVFRNPGVPIPINIANSNNFRILGGNVGLSSVGVPLPINLANSNNFGNSGGNVGISSVGVPLPTNLANSNNFGGNVGISSGSVGVPLPVPVNTGSFNNLQNFGNNFGFSSANFGVPLPINSGNANGFRTSSNNVGVPLPGTQGNTQNNSGFGGNIGVPLPGTEVSSNSFTGNDNSVTVGDLVQSLDGQNGIRVVSLGDLRGSSAGSGQNLNDEFLQQLRDAMAVQNDQNLGQGQINSVIDLSVGVPIPSVNANNGITQSGGVNTQDVLQSTSGLDNTAGRQFDFQFENNANSQNDIGVIDDLIFDATITVGGDGAGFPQSGGAGSLDTFFSGSSGSSGGSSNQDLFPVVLANVAQETFSDAIDDTPIEDVLDDTFEIGDGGLATPLDDDYDFGSYEDDLSDLPVQPPNVFRTGLSDIFFTKGQWIGTLVGGLFDVGTAIGSSVAKIFKKNNSNETA